MAPGPELTRARAAEVGDITVRRLPPLHSRRTVGDTALLTRHR